MCPGGVFWRRFAYVFASLCGIVLPKIARKILLLSGALRRVLRFAVWKNAVLGFLLLLLIGAFSGTIFGSELWFSWLMVG